MHQAKGGPHAHEASAVARAPGLCGACVREREESGVRVGRWQGMLGRGGLHSIRCCGLCVRALRCGLRGDTLGRGEGFQTV